VHNSWEPEKNLTATESIKEYYQRNPRSIGAEKWIRTAEVVVQTIITIPLLSSHSQMPFHSSSTEALVERAMEHGYFSCGPSLSQSPEPSPPGEAMEEDPCPSPRLPVTNLSEIPVTHLCTLSVTTTSCLDHTSWCGKDL
jgi:hypothetical protein